MVEHALEAVGVGSVLFDDFFSGVLEVFVDGDEGPVVEDGEGLVERLGAEAGFEARNAEEIVLGEGEALEGEGFLGVDGLVDGKEVGAEIVDGGVALRFGNES